MGITFMGTVVDFVEQWNGPILTTARTHTTTHSHNRSLRCRIKLLSALTLLRILLSVAAGGISVIFSFNRTTASIGLMSGLSATSSVRNTFISSVSTDLRPRRRGAAFSPGKGTGAPPRSKLGLLEQGRHL